MCTLVVICCRMGLYRHIVAVVYCFHFYQWCCHWSSVDLGVLVVSCLSSLLTYFCPSSSLPPVISSLMSLFSSLCCTHQSLFMIVLSATLYYTIFVVEGNANCGCCVAGGFWLSIVSYCCSFVLRF